MAWSHFQGSLLPADLMAARSIDWTTAFPGDGVGDLGKNLPAQTPAELAAAGAVIDAQPGNTSTTATLTIGQGVRSTLNTPGDWDFFKVDLQAGVTYEIGMYGVRGDPLSGYSGVVLLDSFVEIYDAAGNLITFGDGGASTQLNTVNTGLDVLLAFKPETAGTYYVNARAFDNNAEDGDTGELVGDYDLFVRHSLYEPYYDLDSPLHSIDWGTQFDGTSRNPDGAEGPRVTGNPVENKLSGKNDLYVYFAREGDVFVDNSANPTNLTTTIVAKGLQPWEKAAFNYVFDEYEKVADLNYIETDDRWAADIVVVTYNGTPGPGLSLLGRMSPPDTASEGQTEYNAGDERWTQRDLAPGGFYFGTLIHEFGHGHGMAHPHDTGGRSSEMRGVEPAGIETPGPTIPDPIGVWPNYTLGDYDLNQGVYTMMSYQDGWQKAPWGPQLNDLGRTETKSGYGWIASLMAFDIAVIQDKYGVNEEWATGDDTYVLKDVNQAAEFDAQGNVTREATSYKSIWDAGGVDQIVYTGARNANIDLRAATLQYEYGGGGWISWAYGIHGGYTIANAVTIENATSGSGNDVLTGNAANNVLDGGAGADFFNLQYGGDDTAIAGDGRDVLYYGAALTGADSNNGGDEAGDPRGDLLILQGNYSIAFAAGTLVDVETLRVLRGDNATFGDTAGNFYNYNITTHDANVGPGAQLTVQGGSLRAGETLVFNGSAETDGGFQVFGGRDSDLLIGGAQFDHLLGRAGNDTLTGNGGDDLLRGGLGGDLLVGGAGADTFAYAALSGAEGYTNAVLESLGVNRDTIDGFVWGEDKINLPNAVTAIGTDNAGALSQATFDADLAAALGSFTAGSAVLFTPDSGGLAGRHFLVIDADGSGGYQANNDFVIELVNPSSLIPPTDASVVFI